MILMQGNVSLLCLNLLSDGNGEGELKFSANILQRNPVGLFSKLKDQVWLSKWLKSSPVSQQILLKLAALSEYILHRLM